MLNGGALHEYKMFVEMILVEKLQAIKEMPGSTKEQIEAEQQKDIINFINQYKEQFKIENIEDVTAEKIIEVMGPDEVAWAKKRIEEKNSKKEKAKKEYKEQSNHGEIGE